MGSSMPSELQRVGVTVGVADFDPKRVGRLAIRTATETNKDRLVIQARTFAESDDGRTYCTSILAHVDRPLAQWCKRHC